MSPDINMKNRVTEAQDRPSPTANTTNTSTGVEAPNNGSTEIKSESDPWPPKPPDMNGFDAVAECEPQPFAVSSTQLYKFKNEPKVLKGGGKQHEFDMMIAAGDCSIRPICRIFIKDMCGDVLMTGYVMELGTPLEAETLRDDSSLHKKSLMDQMISMIHSLHNKGLVHGDIKPANMLFCSDEKLRLCDFAEARKVDDDLDSWDGFTTDNYMSPHRCRNWPDGPDPPPTIEDDLYGLGLSIWELFVGEIPFKDVYMDDILDAAKLGGTVDVNRVDDESVREVIRKYLRCGGAKI